jgi:hypothetical protein
MSITNIRRQFGHEWTTVINYEDKEVTACCEAFTTYVGVDEDVWVHICKVCGREVMS